MLIGLTGTFASGKSTVAALLEAQGAATLDADAVARDQVLPGSPALEEIRAAFGAEFIRADGTLDRPRLGGAVFASRPLRERLEAIVHPRVIDAMRRRTAELAAASEPPRWIVWNVPLLFEAGMDAEADEVVVVAVNEAMRFHRARLRDGLTEREVVQRLAAQWPQREKIRRADRVIENSGTPAATAEQVRRMVAQWRDGTDAKD